MEVFKITPCKILFILVIIIYFSSTYLSYNRYANCRHSNFVPENAPLPDKNIDRHLSQAAADHSPTTTNLSHLAFGLIGSEKAWQHRRSYIESWWRPNATNGYIFLDKSPGPTLLPWPDTCPPFRVSDNIGARRMVHGIMEVLREAVDHENLRWVVMGDDDSIFFVENVVDILAQYDHTKYYYLGGHSEFILSNYHFSFDQAFGGGGVMLSYPLARALATDMETCVKRYEFLNFADNTTRVCVADIGVNLLPQKGNHQIDLRGDISGLLQAHPQTPLISLHHFDMVNPIFPSKDRVESTRHLMTAAKADQSRMLQQTICHHRQSNWSVSISWGYSAHIYERIMPRSYLRIPVETFKPWVRTPRPPNYVFKTRKRSGDPCETPHVFFFDSVEETTAAGDGSILSRYSRAWPRALPACSSSGNHSAEFIHTVHVFSPATKRTQTDRCECCDIIEVGKAKAEIRIRECITNEIIA